ncbi:MAG TPA: DNA translocase FtsK 4TM domain-containing protein, partial [Thermodesulfovibrionales bacterium]|nr:DNA translocase FtsK 4TM domain-containing protein [Thermodesulfovibrionales bacterium]
MAERLERIRTEIIGVLSVLGAVYIALSLATYSKWDASFFVLTPVPAKNYGGVFGSYIADLMISIIGVIAFVIPAALVVYGVRRLLGREGHRINIIGTMLLILSLSIFSALVASTFRFGPPNGAGGAAGVMISDFMKAFLSLPGAFIFSLALLISSVILLSPVSLVSLILNAKGSERKKEERSAPLPAAEEVSPLPDAEIYPVSEEPIIHGDLPLFEKLETVDIPKRKAVREPRRTAEGVGQSEVTGGEYRLPPLELLHEPDAMSARPPRDELLSSSTLLEKKLKDFDVDGKVTQVHPGPVVTMYEFEPAPGVKINRIVSLADDLALSLKAQSVRVSTILGKAAIGIEVPNRNRETVCLREILSSEPFGKSYTKLTLALGKDIFGNPVVADLSKMPHLLVAGATGSGKSVSINAMVVSLLYKATPREVKMLMIDPKLLELSSYENIPHLISPVITGAKEAAEALRKMVFEMERRYRLLAEKGVRNIEGFNRVVPDEEQIPYIVIFIDELADLMFASGNEVEDSIARLAQMARASGIHLILATQRPSVDVITGVIKANFPARIAFQVTSRIDSRT